MPNNDCFPHTAEEALALLYVQDQDRSEWSYQKYWIEYAAALSQIAQAHENHEEQSII